MLKTKKKRQIKNVNLKVLMKTMKKGKTKNAKL